MKKKIAIGMGLGLILIAAALASIYYLFPGAVTKMAVAAGRQAAGFTEKTVQVDDHRIVYVEGGKGETILLIALKRSGGGTLCLVYPAWTLEPSSPEPSPVELLALHAHGADDSPEERIVAYILGQRKNMAGIENPRVAVTQERIAWWWAPRARPSTRN